MAMRYVSFEVTVFGVRPMSLMYSTRENAIADMLKHRQAGFGVTCIARDRSGRGRAMYLTPKSCKLKPAI